MTSSDTTTTPTTTAGSSWSGVPRRLSTYDRVGLLLVTVLLDWVWISALINDTTAWPLTLLVLTAVAAYGLARSRPQSLEVLAPGLVLFLFASVLVQPAAASGDAAAPPLGYGNANGALFGLGVAAAALLAVRALGSWRMVWWGTTLGLLLLTAATMSRAATVLAIVVVLVAWCARRWASALRRWIPLVAPALPAVIVAVTVAWALGKPAFEPGRAEELLSARRVQLWSEAVDMIRAEPWFGVGPGRFEVESPTGLLFPDTDQTHSEYLQFAAETGVPGLVLLGGVVCWSFGALRRSGQDPRSVAIVAGATAALSVQAAVDYVWHFPALVVVAASLLGAASAPAGPARPKSAVHVKKGTE